MKLWHSLLSSLVEIPGFICGVMKSRVCAASLPASRIAWKFWVVCILIWGMVLV